MRNYVAIGETVDPDFAICDNTMRGRVEQFEILRDLPDRFTAYLANDYSDHVGALIPVMVWTGDRLGTAFVRSIGKRANMFGERQRYGRATVKGVEYSWQGPGAGMYAHFRKMKARNQK